MPKAIVHGHGGMVLEHLKVLALHTDLGPSDRFFWFSTTGWMMWNYLVGGLLLGSTIVLYEGSPNSPDLRRLWQLACDERVTYFGTSAPFLMACRAAGLDLSGLDLNALRGVGSTGAPLPAEGFEWVYEHVGAALALGSASGGTDLCTAFVLGCPWLPVRSGELQCAALGASVQAFGADGTRVVGELGELVLTQPMPCMPVYFWNDPDGNRLRASYFEPWPHVWRHGDWLCQYEDGAAVIYGRSDATLNRGGVRMGTSEFYRVVEELAFVADSLVVDTSELGREGQLWLFVVLTPEIVDEGAAFAQLRRVIRSELSPRHIPDHVLRIAEVPYTLSGKKLEIPVQRILKGEAPEVAANLGTLKNPDALTALARVAAGVSAG
jgi:acetoacetyl-CoA synthetase